MLGVQRLYGRHSTAPVVYREALSVYGEWRGRVCEYV